MLLFKPEHVMPILDGVKTETRRVWKKARVRVGSVQQAKTELFGAPFALLKILDVHREAFQCLTEEDARAEGGYTREGFIRKFFQINPKLRALTDDGKIPFNVLVVEFKELGDS